MWKSFSPWVELPSRGGFGALGRVPGPRPGNSAAPKPMTEERKAATSDQLWLDSEKHWRHRVGSGWVAKRVLGRGGFGIVGHWKYRGADRDQKRLVDIVVKQSADRHGGLVPEAQIYMDLNTTRTLHAPKMYRKLYVDKGRNTVTGGYDTGTIHRLFLEYCPGGDMASYQKTLRKGIAENEIAVPCEVSMWEFFHCLALGAHVMQQGNETGSEPSWKKEIVHFDLKPANLLFGEPAQDTEHVGSRPLKVSDFGLALTIDPREGQTIEFHDKHRSRGTRAFLHPEQSDDINIRHPHDFRPWWGDIERTRYGSPGNIWQMGLIMWCLQHGLTSPSSWSTIKIYESRMTSLWLQRQPHGCTVGNAEDVEDDRLASPKNPKDPRYAYSKTLKALIKECLLIQSDKRPTPQYLVDKTRRGLEDARIASKKVSLLAPPPAVVQTLYPDPEISARWYSGQPVEAQAQQAQAEAEAQLAQARKAAKAQERAEARQAQARKAAKAQERAAARQAKARQAEVRQAQMQRDQAGQKFKQAQAQQPPDPAANQPQMPQPAKPAEVPRRQRALMLQRGAQNRARERPLIGSVAQVQPQLQGKKTPKLFCRVQEPDRQEAREVIFRDVDESITFGGLKDMLAQAGCAIPKEQMKISAGLDPTAKLNHQTLRELREFEYVMIAVKQDTGSGGLASALGSFRL